MFQENNNTNKFCTNCGAELNNSDDGFCINCGTSFFKQNPLNNLNNNFTQQTSTNKGFFNENSYCQKNGYSAEIKTTDWLKLFALNLLSIIPFFGTIALFVIWLILAFNDNVAKSMQNYVRACLILGVILIMLLVIPLTFLFASNSSIV